MRLDDMRRKLGFNRARIVPALRSAGIDKLAEDISYCGSWTNVAKCSRCGARYFAGVARCKSRFCSICARLRAEAWLAKLVPLLRDYIARGCYVFFLNLTLLNRPELAPALDAIRAAWRFMTHDDKAARAAWNRLNSGGVRSTEVKLGAGSGLWHPHLHCLTLYRPPAGVLYARQFEDYRALWQRAVNYATGTTENISGVHIHGIRDMKGDGGLIAGVVETFKYIAKSDWLELSPEHIRELVAVTKGKHFVSAWGELYGLNSQVEELLARTPAEEIRGRACAACGCTEFELDAMLTDELPDGLRDFD